MSKDQSSDHRAEYEQGPDHGAAYEQGLKLRSQRGV